MPYIPPGPLKRLHQKEQYVRIQSIVHGKSGEVLSKTYANTRTPMRFRCEKGHVFKTRPGRITQGHWCLRCAQLKRAKQQSHTIQEIQQIAREKGGQCLSKTYKNNKTKLTWRCSQKHTWQTTPQSILQGTWCPKCHHNKRKKQ